VRYRPELDGIRAFAVLAVIAFHAGVAPARGGWLGVDIFFVLSGYLITQVLLREHARTGAINLRDFWVRRLLRLYPALLLALVLGVFFYTTLGYGGTIGGYLKTAAAAGLYFENFVWGLGNNELGLFGHTWSLAVEMQFYLVWPLLLAWILAKRQRPTRWIIVGIVISFGLYVLQSTPEPVSAGHFPVAYYMPWTRAFELLAGALLAALEAQRSERRAEPRPGRHWIGWLIGVGYGVVFFASWIYSIYVHQRAIIWESGAATILTVLLLLHLDRVRTAGVGRLLAWRPIAWIGSVSYAVYLIHYPVIQILEHKVGHHAGHPGLASGKGMLVMATVISLALAAISWRLVEKPALKLKDRFEHQPMERATQPID
jgi:peptidoglycan/LPS O-acetylase OafA/YrhL